MSAVFVAGATGVLGRRAVKLLVGAGHDVTGVARTDEKAALLRSLGATPARLDPFDAAAVKVAVEGHDVVVNLATHIPRVTRGALPGAWHENDRIRREVSANLVNAAIASGARCCIQESITFGYVDRGDEWIDEQSPYEARSYDSVIAAETNARRFTDSGGAGVVLRFGMFYDAESHTTSDLVRAATMGRLALPGRAGAYASFLATEDAASAVVAALDAPAGTYNVVDDEPLTRAELAQVFAKALGRSVGLLPSVTTLAARTTAQTEPLARSARVSNRAFKRASGWEPSRPTMRVGMPPVIKRLVHRPRHAARSFRGCCWRCCFRQRSLRACGPRCRRGRSSTTSPASV